MSDNLDCSALLAPAGPIAAHLTNYEQRPQQLAMALAIDQAFARSHHLVVEAGTGIGKSFAYLVPAIRWAKQQRQQVVVSTYTIALQEQLIYKDIPFLQQACPIDFTATLAKGRAGQQ